MMTSSNGTIFHVTGHLCGEFAGLRWIPRTKASDAEFDVFVDLRLNKRRSKQSWDWWFETPSCPLWRHSNARDRRITIAGDSIALHKAIDVTNVYFCEKNHPLRDAWGNILVAKPVLELWHGWGIASTQNIGMWFLIHSLTSTCIM